MMAGQIPLTISSPGALTMALAIAAIAGAVAWWRRPAVPVATHVCAAVALVMLALAAGGARWRLPAVDEVVVMIDQSPSTRTATYHDPRALESRLDQLLGNTPRRIVQFSDANAVQTEFSPPPAGAILLLSDARFELPRFAPPTYVLVDPALENPQDASVSRLEIRGDDLVATVENRSDQPRTMRWTAVSGEAAQRIEPGSFVFTRPLAPGALSASVQLSSGDTWPENDALSIVRPPPTHAARWWIGVAAPAEWKSIAPADLPADTAAYLAPAVILLQNVAATNVSAVQLERLMQYVRDLGGGLVIIGGERAFAAGDYPGTSLESLSPLASHPPTPAMHWMLLVDSSGSMAEGSAGTTRWNLAKAALLNLLPHLPPEDSTSVGSFSRDLRWWTRGRGARQTRAMTLPPADVSPHGPTNLDAALKHIAAEHDGAMATQLLVMTDAQAKLDDPDALAAALREKKIRLHVLAIGQGDAMDALREMSSATGGTMLEQFDPRQWTESVRQLLRQAAPPRVMETPGEVTFVGELSSLGARSVSPWNRTWIKNDSTALTAPGDGPAAAMWQIGAGKVAAAGFESVEIGESLAELVSAPPRDPRIKVTWQSAETFTAHVDALDGGYLNGLHLELELAAETHLIPQTAPGRYELELPAPRSAGVATVRHEGRVVERIAFAGRYAAEFNRIGNDRAAMTELARRTGGRVIEPDDGRAIDLPAPDRHVLLVPYLALAGALLLALGLARWRMG